MAEQLILHHYDNSPYAEKIRLVLGLTDSHWQSVKVPAWPPRLHLDRLTGGYRRIPVAQLGADIFCDTEIIAEEVARLTDNPLLNPSTIDGEANRLMRQAEGEVFFAAVKAIPQSRLMMTMLNSFGLVGSFLFIKDRGNLFKGGNARPPGEAKAKAILNTYLEALEQRLADNDWVGGDSPSIADFACFHPLWLHENCDRRPLSAGSNVQDWFERIKDFGHGHHEEISGASAIKKTRSATPRPVPQCEQNTDIALGSQVQVAPQDYGVKPVTGELMMANEQRIIIARKDAKTGTVHVHFPRSGYRIKPG